MERIVPLPAAVFVNPAAGRGSAGRKVAEAREAFVRRKYSVEIVQANPRQNFAAECRPRYAKDVRR
jgi:diacylglycerol kinase family enzyme